MMCSFLMAPFLLVQATVQLTQDQYGNYVIQHVLEHGKEEERSYIISQLAPHILALSQNKFASNVVEKCLLFGNPQHRVALVEAILTAPPQPLSEAAATGGMGNPEGLGTSNGELSADPLYEVMKDQFGNYVVQKVLEVRKHSHGLHSGKALHQQLAASGPVITAGHEQV